MSISCQIQAHRGSSMSRAPSGDSSSSSSRISFSQAMSASVASFLSSQITVGGSCGWQLLCPPAAGAPPCANVYSFEVCQIRYQHRISQILRTRVFGLMQAGNLFFPELEAAPFRSKWLSLYTRRKESIAASKSGVFLSCSSLNSCLSAQTSKLRDKCSCPGARQARTTRFGASCIPGQLLNVDIGAVLNPVYACEE